jgi:hypothetical protein
LSQVHLAHNVSELASQFVGRRFARPDREEENCVRTWDGRGSQRLSHMAAIGACALVVALIALAPGSASASSVDQIPCNGTGDGPRNVIAVGDSITLQLTDALHWDSVLAHDPISVHGHCGYRIDQLRSYLKWDAALLPHLRQVFFFGGTNDAWRYHNDAVKGLGSKGWRLQWSIDELHAAVHDVIDPRPRACMFLVTVRDWYLPGYAYFHKAAVRLNTEMKSIADAFPTVHLIDWNRASQGHPEYFKDGIGHVTAAGAKVLAGIYQHSHDAWNSACRG